MLPPAANLPRGGSRFPEPAALPKAEPFRRWSVEDYLIGYKRGTFGPVEVAKTIIDAVKRSDAANPPLRSVIQMNETKIMEDATAAAGRIKSGAKLSALDGIPILFKEEIDVQGYLIQYAVTSNPPLKYVAGIEVPSEPMGEL
jgi:Asp-tRNA(Asn)/Glu-tRNA(Gln) amidotransferase A subunit family amidase